jgi:hypothetical protein
MRNMGWFAVIIALALAVTGFLLCWFVDVGGGAVANKFLLAYAVPISERGAANLPKNIVVIDASAGPQKQSGRSFEYSRALRRINLVASKNGVIAHEGQRFSMWDDNSLLGHPSLYIHKCELLGEGSIVGKLKVSLSGDHESRSSTKVNNTVIEMWRAPLQEPGFNLYSINQQPSSLSPHNRFCIFTGSLGGLFRGYGLLLDFIQTGKGGLGRDRGDEDDPPIRPNWSPEPLVPIVRLCLGALCLWGGRRLIHYDRDATTWIGRNRSTALLFLGLSLLLIPGGW